MDSIAARASTDKEWAPFRPAWAFPAGREASDADAAFSAGIALKSLDDLVRSQPRWAGCWRARQALKCAAVATRLLGRGQDEAAIRDAALLTAAGNDAGPAGRLFVAYKRLTTRKPVLSSASIAEIAEVLDLVADERLADIVDQADAALQSGRAAPLAAAELVTAIVATRPEAEPLAWMLADMLIAILLNWERPVPLLIAERYGPAFRGRSGAAAARGRIRPGEPAFARAVCLAFAEATGSALRSAGEISRRADRLVAAGEKLRTKGGEVVICRLLDEDALLASAPGADLSRWASTRMFERLQGLDAVRELSGRTSFRLYGL
jgi:hypothetical protein